MANKGTIANNKYRLEVLEELTEFFKKKGEDVLQIASNSFCFPFVNSEGDDEFLKITVVIPKGSRGDTHGYDGYEQAEQFTQKKKEKAEKAEQAKKKKQRQFEQAKAEREYKAQKKKEQEEKGE